MRTRRYGEVESLRLSGRLGGRDVYPVLVYRIGTTMVDSGCPRCAGTVVAWARERGVRRVVHTHHHEDHVGASAGIAETLGAEVLAPQAALGLLERPYRLPLYRRLVWGQPRPVAARPLGGAVEIGGRRFEVVPTPGHAPDHVCFFQPEERWLFTGDLYVAARTRYLRAVEDAGVILASLRRVAKLRPRVVFCSHSGVVENGTEALEAKIEWWEGIAERAAELARAGAGIREITRRLLGPEGWMTRISGGAFAKRHLVASLLRARRVS